MVDGPQEGPSGRTGSNRSRSAVPDDQPPSNKSSRNAKTTGDFLTVQNRDSQVIFGNQNWYYQVKLSIS